MDLGTAGGIIGGAIGFAGGLVGIYCSIKNTLGPRERAFMIRTAAVAWLAVAAFIVGLFYIPQPYKWSIWMPYGLALAFGIRWSNRRQAQIRAEESATGSDPASR